MRKHRYPLKCMAAVSLGCLLLICQSALSAGDAKEEGEQELSPACIKMQQDLNADLGKQHTMGCLGCGRSGI